MILLYHIKHGHRLLPGGHLEDLPACGKPAIALTRRHPIRTGRVPVRDTVRLNGQRSEDGAPLICWSCGCPVQMDWLSDQPPMQKVRVVNRSEIKERWDVAV